MLGYADRGIVGDSVMKLTLVAPNDTIHHNNI